MAMVCSGSSSSRLKRNYYEVFVSFRGEDTRSNFTDHLFGALQRKGIVPFRDDTKLEKGESIAPELEKAIEESEVFIVVLSKNYASSTWCLQELVKILNFVQVLGKCVLPIFYDVDPSEVRKQSGDYMKAFAEHEERFKNDSEKLVEVQKWREALTQVANLSGWHIKDQPQYALIEEIVRKIINILDHKLSRLPNDLVGMQSRVEKLAKLLHLGLVDDVRVVGISGMSGIGKTTLATVLFGRIFHQFDAYCFIDDVSKIYQKSGPTEVQKQLLDQTLKEEKLQICNHYNATNLIQRRLCNLRTLIVLDNVDHVEQLEKLGLNRERLGAGSRIIIISKDEHILKEYPVDEVYNVQPLGQQDSIQLFCGKAFKSQYIKEGCKWFIDDALTYVGGHPLAIKVLGSFLFDRNVYEWRSALSRLRENPTKDIMDVLRLSFDELEKNEKEIFLDIACFFNNHDREYVKEVLNCCGFHVDIGIRVLLDKSLITYNDRVDTIQMHRLLRELGRKIVQEKWSRLWRQKHFHNDMSKNLENNVEAIVLAHYYEHDLVKRRLFMAETLSKMSCLRLLILDQAYFSGSLDCLSNKLRYVKWYDYPFKYLPSNFQPNQLVILILKFSSIKELWKGNKDLPNLRKLNLSHSINLIKMPDFGEVPNLERLKLKGCVELVHIDPSIGVLKELIYLNLQDCKSLVSIPINILGLKSLEYLNLSGCSKVSIKPMHTEHLKKLDTSETMLHPRSKSPILKFIQWPFNFLSPKARKDSCSASCLPLSFPGFACLLELDFSFCNLCQIPDAIGYMCCLERLNLSGNHFAEMPSLREFSQLTYLNLEHCKQLKSLPELPSHSKLHLAHPPPWKNKAGIFIFNCPKLHKREHCSSMTISWMMQTIQHALQESFNSFDVIEIVIAGGEIPRWFSHQSVGNSISIDPSPILYDNNCIGLVCCVIFVPHVAVPHDDPTTLSSEEYNHIEIQFSESFAPDIIIALNRYLAMFESNHMWLIYFHRETFFYEGVPEVHEPDHIKMTTRVLRNSGWHLEVKNLGYRWVCKQDLELFDVTTMHGGDSSTLKRKFLAIEDKAQAQP